MARRANAARREERQFEPRICKRGRRRTREAKLEWLRIQEKKLDTLLNDPKSKKVKPELLARWIKDTEADIAKTKRELGYEG